MNCDERLMGVIIKSRIGHFFFCLNQDYTD